MADVVYILHRYCLWLFVLIERILPVGFLTSIIRI